MVERGGGGSGGGDGGGSGGREQGGGSGMEGEGTMVGRKGVQVSGLFDGTETLVVPLWRPWERQQQWGTVHFVKGLQPKI